jgi:hypothetical protein
MRVLGIVLLFFLLVVPSFSSPYYIFVGGYNLVPISKFKETNKTSLGYSFQIQNRAYCNLWFGGRLDYSKLDSLEKVPVGTNYFDSYLAFSPEIRYIFLLSEKNIYDDSFYLFFQGLLHLSSISLKQQANESNLGLGGSIGGGIGFCFNLFKLCWAVEFDATYGSPNFILKSTQRTYLTHYNIGLNLGVRL